jgi:DNA-binding NarL/FixJ family response regulator
MKSSPNAMTQQIRVLVADDHPVVREGLVAIFKSQNDIKVIAQATNGEETFELCHQHLPDVLLLDLRMPKKDGLQVIPELMARSSSKPRVIVMTTCEREEDIRRALKAGAKGYLVKGTARRQIRESVRRVAKGESFVPPEIESKLAKSMGYRQLSKREDQVLQCLSLGRTNKEIGQALSIGEGTIKHHVKSILRKLEATGRTQAVGIAVRRGLLHVG